MTCLFHWSTVCQYGVVHSKCRCDETKPERVIECPTPPVCEGAYPFDREISDLSPVELEVLRRSLDHLFPDW